MASRREQAKARREHARAPALGARVSLDVPIHRVVRPYGTNPRALLGRHHRHDDPPQVLVCLAKTWCRGSHSLTHLAEELGPISPGALTHAPHMHVGAPG